MSTESTHERTLYENRAVGQVVPLEDWVFKYHGVIPSNSGESVSTPVGTQIKVSEGHRQSRKTGKYYAGGPFYTSLKRSYSKRAFIRNAYDQSTARVYTGPIGSGPPTQTELSEIGAPTKSYGDKNESSMKADGTTAISLCNPINPASNLGTSLAESVKEGIPSLPGIQQWRRKTEVLKGLGDEYLNYIFGWAPLAKEVSDVRYAAQHHRDLLKQYHRGEGSNTHRSFYFPSKSTTSSLPQKTKNVTTWSMPWGVNGGTRQVFKVEKTKRWFEGVFTYGLPSSHDSWRKALGFGSDADRLFGLTLTPDVLWELTPWSWAVDWFSNTGMLINNVTNFGLAGLVMRYGYMMEESIVDVYAEGSTPPLAEVVLSKDSNGDYTKSKVIAGGVKPGTYRQGIQYVTKRRVPASPFGFSIGWEGLSPTQLAITAALGITRLL